METNNVPKSGSATAIFGLFAILALMIAIAFYWFQVRPASARSFCVERANLSARDAVEYKKQEAFEGTYNNCMISKGVKEYWGQK